MTGPVFPKSTVGSLALSVVALAAIAGIYWWLLRSGIWATAFSGDGPLKTLQALGPWGPIAIVGLMTVAIVVSPLPSAPIAVAAGALYGHAYGTVYVIVGAEIGAVIAFYISRIAGAHTVQKLAGDFVRFDTNRSQNVLMALVFVSRLIPFLSFDAVSYAAGLTTLKAWRFALATFAGIAPASFFLAHTGTSIASSDWIGVLATFVVILGMGAFGAVAYGRYRGGAPSDRPRQDDTPPPAQASPSRFSDDRP